MSPPAAPAPHPPVSFKAAGRIGRLPYFRGRDRLAHMMLRHAARGGPVVTEVDGIRLALELSDRAEAAILRDGRFPSEVGAVLASKVSAGMTTIDVGANIGWTAITAARLVGPGGRVLAFEPSLAVFDRLERNAGLNDVSWLRTERAACGSEASTATLYSASGASVFSSLQPVIRSQTDATEQVPVIVLDERCRELDVRPDFAKIDVEGAEWEVLRGMTGVLEADGPGLLLELSVENASRFGYDPRELIDWLGGFGYGYDPAYSEAADVERRLQAGEAVDVLFIRGERRPGEPG